MSLASRESQTKYQNMPIWTILVSREILFLIGPDLSYPFNCYRVICDQDGIFCVHSIDFEPNDPRLRSHECLKNAAGLSVDSTSAVLSQTVYAVTKIEKEYVELVNVLIVLIEYQLQVLGHAAEEERIGDLIVETRHEINKVKQRKEDLRLLFSSVEKLADASAEVAFAAGAAYASTSAGERLYSAQQEVKRVQSESEEVEQRLHEAQARSVEALSQHEEQRQTALKRAEQERHSAEESLAAEKTSSDTQTSSSEQFTGDSVADDDLSEK
ncbi:hypothetical protein RRG08_030758 [Elysia crispata]|uniref:Direct IAP-binding protein with low pI n=1 Tax=Elysia crispata TaxID=231223 RepID=A0AAE0YFK9_9GAST|nr:hypothetical protein RRG08_030758 [Elysia crispata]